MSKKLRELMTEILDSTIEFYSDTKIELFMEVSVIIM